MNVKVMVIAALANILCSCDGQPVPEERDIISYKARADAALVRVERTHRLSETETIKVVIVPGYPMGDRCVIYSSERGETMQCREISPGQQ